VLLVDGGDATYLCHWMRDSGLADLLPSLPDTVWVGVSAGSVVMTPRIGTHFVEWPAAPNDRTLGRRDRHPGSEGQWTKFDPSPVVNAGS
jgi:dipeptidase E